MASTVLIIGDAGVVYFGNFASLGNELDYFRLW